MANEPTRDQLRAWPVRCSVSGDGWFVVWPSWPRPSRRTAPPSLPLLAHTPLARTVKVPVLLVFFLTDFFIENSHAVGRNDAEVPRALYPVSPAIVACTPVASQPGVPHWRGSRISCRCQQSDLQSRACVCVRARACVHVCVFSSASCYHIRRFICPPGQDAECRHSQHEPLS